MTTIKKPSAALFALTASALSLPIYAPAVQAGVDTNIQTGYRYSRYREDDLAADKAASGTTQSRYEVDSHQFELVYPYAEQMGFSTDVIYETMSGASPWYSTPAASGNKAVQVMSGATIKDQRVALDLHTHLYQQDSKETFTLGVNHERDYLSFSGGVEGEWSFDEQRRTLSGGVGYSHDQLKPTEGGTSKFATRIANADKSSVNAVLGYSQVLTQDTVVQVAFNYTFSNGYLSDPYKLAYVVVAGAGTLVQDSRPSHRTQFAANLRLRQFFPSLAAALHLDYRNFSDNWGVVSNTLELGWHQKLPDDWKLVPAIRYYEQGRADFYSPYFATTRTDGNYSSDYRLSPYGALSYRLGVDKSWSGWKFSLSGEMYRSKASYALKKVDPSTESPGLVNFSVISVSAGYSF